MCARVRVRVWLYVTICVHAHVRATLYACMLVNVDRRLCEHLCMCMCRLCACVHCNGLSCYDAQQDELKHNLNCGAPAVRGDIILGVNAIPKTLASIKCV